MLFRRDQTATFFPLETINDSLFSSSKLEHTNLTTFVSLRYDVPSRRLEACRPIKMHLIIEKQNDSLQTCCWEFLFSKFSP